MTPSEQSDSFPCVRCGEPTQCTWRTEGKPDVGLCLSCFHWVVEDTGPRTEVIDALAYGMEDSRS